MNNPAGLIGLLKRHGLPLLVVFIPLLVLFPLCGYDFISLDDPANVYDNTFLTHFSWANLAYFWRATYEFLYIPLTYNLWGVAAKISQLIHADGASLDPRIFHGLNLLVHLAATAVLYRILYELLADKWGAAGGALLFAVHPVQVEAVAWVTGFKDVLSGFWCLLSLWLYLLYSREEAGARKRRLLYAAAALVYLFAALSKPTAVILFLLVGIVGRLLLKKSHRQLFLELLPWVALTLPVVLVTISAQNGNEVLFIPSYWQRLLVAGDAVSFYLCKLFLPISLTFDYGRTPQYVLGHDWGYLAGIFPYVALLLLGLRYRRPQLHAGVGLFLFPLLPVLGFIPFNFQNISTVADRYLYLAMVGPAFLLAWGVSHYRNKIAGSIVMVGLVVLVLRTAYVLPQWENSDSFYAQGFAANLRSWTSLLNIGIKNVSQGKLESALVDFQRVLVIKPDLPAAYFAMGIVYEKMGDQAAAIPAYQRAVALDPKYDEAFDKLGLISYESGKKAEAIEYFKKAVAIAPGSKRAARFYADMGMTYAESGDFDSAVGVFRKALALNPYLGGVYSALGDLYLSRNQAAAALEMYNNDLKIDQKNSMAFCGLGKAYALLGQKEKGVESLRRALELEPDSGPFNYNLAELYRELGQHDLANNFASKAKALGYDDQAQR